MSVQFLDPKSAANAPYTANGATNGEVNGHALSAEAAAALRIQEKYAHERDKRLRAEGDRQFIDIGLSDKFKHFSLDLWAESEPPIADARDIVPESRCKVLILGTGFVGLTVAARLIQAGIRVEDMRMADTACGYGGTWYWNRYPGLMCDIESYIYMPLLEEMNYMPEHKYAYGTELRKYANLLADEYKLRDKTMFQTGMSSTSWDDNAKEWIVELRQERIGHEARDIQVRASMVCIAGGILHHPKLPSIPGLEKFKGHTFHTARWDYGYTGGSPSDWDLKKLCDKRVGFVGTGATAIQAVPQLAKNAKELFVFQRTPAAVDERNQRATDPEWWSKIAGGKGWQKERNRNFCAHLRDPAMRPQINMVGDAWTRMPSLQAMIGGPSKVTMDNVAQHMAVMHALDLPRQERIRARVDSLVNDPTTASKLKPWYPGWCKRPCFHDDYLPTFNRPNVQLIDTEGAGISSLEHSAVVIGDKTYPIDVLIFGTGFRTPAAGTVASRANLSVKGRSGEDFDTKFGQRMATLHGVVTHGFPNFFFFGVNQTGATAHYTFPADQLAQHVAYMISTAEKQAGPGKKVLIEPTAEAEEAWTMEIMKRAVALAGLAGCTPSYINAEGDTDRMSQEKQARMARGATWGEGYLSFLEVIEDWRRDGRMEGLQVEIV